MATNEDFNDYEWPNMLKAYFGTHLNGIEIETWHSEIAMKLGGITDGQLCDAIRKWGWSSEKHKRRPNLHDLIKHLKAWMNDLDPRQKVSQGMKSKIRYYKDKIDQAKTNDEIWFCICTFCHRHDDNQMIHTRDLEEYAKKKYRFKRPDVSPLFDEIKKSMGVFNETEQQRKRRRSLERLNEHRDKNPF